MSAGQMVGKPNTAEFLSQAQAKVTLAQGYASDAQDSATAAAASETAAGASETAAGASEAAAESAQFSAEAARDAALIQAGVYVDEPTGRAAVADGVAFKVQGLGEIAAYEYRRVDAGSSTLIATYPSGTAFGRVVSDDYSHALTDQNGNVALGVLTDGTVVAGTMEPDLMVFGEVNALDFPNQYYSWGVADSSGNMALGVKTDGTVVVGGLDVSTINGEAPATPTAVSIGTYDDELNHVITYGQSLSDGVNATPVITTSQRHNTQRFVGGVRPLDGGSYASLVALVETVSGFNGETPTAGTCEAIQDLILAENGIAYGAHSYQLLGSASGETAKTIAQLSKGSAYYTELLNHVTQGMALASAAGQTYGVRAVTWSQGESDTEASTAPATYIAALNTLVSDLNTDIKTITGQTRDIHLVTYQFTSHLFYSKTPDIAVALLEAANANPLIHFAVPTYILTHYSDQVHLTALSSKILGAHYGKVIKRVVVDGQTWAPLQPTSARRNGTSVVLTFNVPVAPLVFDTTAVALNTNYGFELVDSGGSPLTISSVALLGDNRVKITAASSVPAGAKVRYGWSGTSGAGPLTGPRGNLRDSEGESCIFDPSGLAVPLHNWCPLFEYGV